MVNNPAALGTLSRSTSGGRPHAVDPDRARALAQKLHGGEPDAGGAPLIDHVRRVAAAVPGDARVVAWLHEVFEYTSISEEALLAEGLSLDELRALRLLTHEKGLRSNVSYLAQVELIARAKGAGASIARSVKGADLADRALNPPIRANGWSPPYELALQILRGAPPPDTFPFTPAAETRTHMTPVADGARDAPAGAPSASRREKSRLGRRARHP